MCTQLPHTHHTLQLFPLPDNLGMMPFAAFVSCLSPEPSSLTLSLQLFAPQSVKCPRNPEAFLCFSILDVFKEDGREENTSVNLMFLGCLIKRDKIAEELGAGLAGVGSHALLPQCCSFRLSRRASCFCPPHPQAWDDGPTGRDACSAGQACPACPSVQSELGGWVQGLLGRGLLDCPGGPEAYRGVSRRAGWGYLGGPLCLVPCAHLRPLHALLSLCPGVAASANVKTQ